MTVPGTLEAAGGIVCRTVNGVLEVAIDCGRLDEDLATLRAVIWAAVTADR